MLKELEGAVLVGEPAHHVIRPDHGHVAGPVAIRRAHHATREVGALDGRLQDELLALAQGDALSHEEVCVEVELVGEALGRETALLVRHGNVCHPGSFRSGSPGGGERQQKGPRPGPRAVWSGQRDSNPRMSAWEADALPLGDARTVRLVRRAEKYTLPSRRVARSAKSTRGGSAGREERGGSVGNRSAATGCEGPWRA